MSARNIYFNEEETRMLVHLGDKLGKDFKEVTKLAIREMHAREFPAEQKKEEK
jgi:hypothetical protein